MTMPEQLSLTDSQKIAVNIISMNTALNDLQHTVDEHEKVLLKGNGELPLRERVRNLEAFVLNFKFWMRTVAVALVLQTITFGTAAIIYFLKLYPLLESLSKSQGMP